MRTSSFAASSALLAGWFAIGPASAGLTDVGAGSAVNCQTSDVQLTWTKQISPSLSPVINFTPGISALACIGFYEGNDQPQPTTNLGYYGDGFANGGQSPANSIYFGTGMFIGTGELVLQDLDKDGKIDDPGWVTVGKYDSDQNKFVANTVNGQAIIGDDASAANGGLQSFFSCTGCANGAKSGSWSLTPDAGIPERFNAAAGEDSKNFFDAFSLVLKGGNYYTAYLFTASQIEGALQGLLGNEFKLSLSDVYNFGGTFTMPTITTTEMKEKQTCTGKGKDKTCTTTWVEKTTSKQYGLSHITALAHDPNDVNKAPAPGTLALLGFGLLGMGFARRRRA